MKKLITIIGIWLLGFGICFSQYQYFEVVLMRTNGLTLTGATAYLVPVANIYPSNRLLLTAHAQKSGVYYRNAVPAGVYDIWVNQAAYNPPGATVVSGYVKNRDSVAIGASSVSTSHTYYGFAADEVTTTLNEDSTISIAPAYQVEKASVDSLRAREVNVRDYGAVGDSTDEYTKLATAISAADGQYIRLPAGIYYSSQSLVVTSNCKGLIGDGTYDPVTGNGTKVVSDETILISANDSRIEHLSVERPSGAPDGIQIRANNVLVNNVAITGTADGAHGLSIEGAIYTGNRAFNVTVTGFKHAFAVRTSNVQLGNLTAINPVNEGIIFKAGTNELNRNITLNGFRFHYGNEETSYGMLFEIASDGIGMENITVTSVVMDSVPGIGIYVVNSAGPTYHRMKNINISDVSIGRVASRIFDSYRASNVTVVNIRAKRSFSSGFQVWECKNIRLIGCAADSVSGYGFYDLGSSDSIMITTGFIGYAPGGLREPSSEFLTFDVNGHLITQTVTATTMAAKSIVQAGIANSVGGAITLLPPDTNSFYHIDNPGANKIRFSQGTNPGDAPIGYITYFTMEVPNGTFVAGAMPDSAAALSWGAGTIYKGTDANGAPVLRIKP